MLALWVALVTFGLTTMARAQIRILAPEFLKRGLEDVHQVIIGSTSTFGAPFFGERVTGRLRHGYSRGNHHCTASDYDIVDLPSGHNTQFKGARSVDIVVVRVGGCSPVTKVKVAQDKDAHAMIFVDDSDKTPEEIEQVFLPDDGEGDRIRIPSILVSKKHGEMLINAMTTDQVVVELSWDIPQSQVVTVDFWFSSGSLEASHFLKGFKLEAEYLREMVRFVPHYDVFDLAANGGSNGKLCSDVTDGSGVQHCAPDPDGPGPVTGADVANEDMRQICLYHVQTDVVQATHGVVKFVPLWWEYVTQLHDVCPLDGVPPNRFGFQSCSIGLMSNLHVPISTIETCLSNKAGKYMEKEAEEHAWSELALRINGWRYRGPLDPETVLKAICSGFAQEPENCKISKNTFMARVQKHITTLSNKTFGFLMFAIVLTSIANCFLYRRYISKLIRRQMREEVMLEVQNQMAEYSKLEDRPAS